MAEPFPESHVPALHSLDQVTLSPRYQAALEACHRRSGGPPSWVRRKASEVYDLLAMSQVAPGRVAVHYLTVDEDLHAVIELVTPVPLMTHENQLDVADRAMIGLTYGRQALLQPQPGYAFASVISPRGVFHPQVSTGGVQRICLGTSLPAGVRVRELVLMLYGLFTMQTFQLDVLDPAGVMNVKATQWWQSNAARIPLSQEPFLHKGGPDLEPIDMSGVTGEGSVL